MNNQWRLDELLADLSQARKQGDLGRLAFVAYCDVRRWARAEGHLHLAEQASRLITQSPAPCLEVFLEEIDKLFAGLEALRTGAISASTAWAPPGSEWLGTHPARI